MIAAAVVVGWLVNGGGFVDSGKYEHDLNVHTVVWYDMVTIQFDSDKCVNIIIIFKGHDLEIDVEQVDR